MTDRCRIEECERDAHRRGLCRGHYARELLGRVVHTPLRGWGDPHRTHREAALAYADADDGDEAAYRRARQRLAMAALRARKRRRHKVYRR